MDPIVATGLLLAGWYAMKQKNDRPPPKAPTAEVLQFIVSAARRHNVPVTYALAFADIESGMDSRCEGDLDWPTRKGGELYRKHVLNAKALAQNPARLEPAAWHSYGLYQLLAPYHVKAKEHPRELLDARVNADRGVAFIGRLLKQNGGDVVAARLAYVGCGADGSRCSTEHVEKVKARLQSALDKWSGLGGVG